MIFLISYDRSSQTLERFEKFETNQETEARRRRLELDLAHDNTEGRYEVVLLEAADEASVRITHARYFSDAHVLIADAKKQLETFGKSRSEKRDFRRDSSGADSAKS